MSRIRRQIFVNQADGGEILPFLFFFPHVQMSKFELVTKVATWEGEGATP